MSEDGYYYWQRSEDAAGRATRASDDARNGAIRAERAADEAKRAACDIKSSERAIIEEINHLRTDLEESRLRETEYLKTIKQLTLKTFELERSLIKQLTETRQIVVNNTNRIMKSNGLDKTEATQKECPVKSTPVVECVETSTSYSRYDKNTH